MIYGHFYYPLYTLGIEQLYRVLEATVSLKCNFIGAPKSKNTLEKKLDYLISRGVISEEESVSWKAIRTLRNHSSHPEDQTILSPSDANYMLHNTAQKINFLFEKWEA